MENVDASGGVGTAETSAYLKTLTERSLEANKVHQYALTRHTEHLMTELQELEKLMSEVATDDLDEESNGEIYIAGAIRAAGPCSVTEFLNPKSPFFEDASRRSRYLNDTVDHPMKNKELDILAEAVKQENIRLKAYASQQSGQSDVDFDVENNTGGINWSIVAENVSKATGSTTTRTADQCRIKWLGDRHPKINHGNWVLEELEKLKGLVSAQTQSNNGKVDWVQVAAELGTNRTPLDCMRRGVTRQRHIWNTEADEKLADAVKLYGTYNWNLVARYVSEDATASQCQARYSRVLDPTRKRGAWTDEEFERLTVAVAAYGNAWIEVAACIPGRSNEQCRERWSEHLSAGSANTIWTEADDLKLTTAVGEIGNKWKEISGRVGNGTTGQQCRLRWEKLKRLLEQQQAAALASSSGPDPSTSTPPLPPSAAPKPKGRSRMNVQPPQQDQEDDSSTNLTARPKPRPKGKGKAKAIELDPTSNDSESTPGGSVAKRAADDMDDVVEIPPKKRRTNKSHAQADAPDNGEPLQQVPTTTKKRGRKKNSTAPEASIENDDSASATTTTPAPPARPKPRPRKKPIDVAGSSEPSTEVSEVNTNTVQLSKAPAPVHADSSGPSPPSALPKPTPERRSTRLRTATASPKKDMQNGNSEMVEDCGKEKEYSGRGRKPRGRGRGRGRGAASGRRRGAKASDGEEADVVRAEEEEADMVHAGEEVDLTGGEKADAADDGEKAQVSGADSG